MAAVLPHSRPAVHDAAFERLYRRYVKDVYRYTLALLRNPADAEDVTQTTFLNAWRAWCEGVDPQKPHNWLIKIAHNAARSRYAAQARRPSEVPLDDHLDELALPVEERPQIEGILRALGRLPFNQRSALVMRELEGRSYSEIADALGVSVSAVETLIFRARRSLRVHASKLRGLAAVPLPQSLASFFENGAAVGGGAALGSGLLAKLGLLLVAGAVAGGVGYKTVRANPPWTPAASAVVPNLRAQLVSDAVLAPKLGALQRSARVDAAGRFGADPVGHLSARNTSSGHDTSGPRSGLRGSTGRLATRPSSGRASAASPARSGGGGGVANDPVGTVQSAVAKAATPPLAVPAVTPPSVPTVSPPSVPNVNDPAAPVPAVKKTLP
jgi:RNA polymerase sigma factor (sigma-70 family)